MADFVDVDNRVQVSNPKHKHFGKMGTVRRIDRGNVWVELDPPASRHTIAVSPAKDRTICTRAKGLTVKGK